MELSAVFSIVSILIASTALYLNLRDKRPRLKILLEPKMKMPLLQGVGVIGGDVFLNLIIKNVGNKAVFVNSVGIDFENEKMYRSVKHLNMLPKELRSEESMTFEFKSIDLVEKLEAEGYSEEKKIIAIVSDDIGRNYKSKPFLIKFSEIRSLKKVIDKHNF